LYRVDAGALTLYRVLTDGRRQVVGFALPGDVVGLGVEGEHVVNAQAVKPTCLRCLAMSALRQSAATDPLLSFKHYQAVVRELAATRDLMLTTGQRSAMERVASFLISLSRGSERNGKDPASFELPMSRTDIGDFLGLTIETVSRTLSKFKGMGLLALPQCNQVALLNIEQLASIANGAHDQNC
jgi:CRP/FNR family transcriptional regulator